MILALATAPHAAPLGPGATVVNAPGAPGVAPTWSSSAKDLVTTALGPGRLWATIGHGIVNEVFWPSTGRPQLRDLGFLVVGPNGWSEVKRVNRYRLATPPPHVPLPTIVHDGDDFRLELEIVPDPLRDVLLIRYRLGGDDAPCSASDPAFAGVLALGFAATPEGAATLCRSSLATGFASAKLRFLAGWRDWGRRLDLPDAPEPIHREAVLSATVLKVHEDRAFPGAVGAGFRPLAAGQVADARGMLAHLIATQNPDGNWAQNFFPDGRPFWSGVQLDETGFPVLLAAKLAELDALDDLQGVEAMVRRAAGYLARHGPSSPQDRWEENAGISPFTRAVAVAALMAAGRFLEPDEAGYAASLADAWNERIEEWTFVSGDSADPGILRACSVDGYYLRIASPEAGLRGRTLVRNRSDGPIDVRDLVSLDYLCLARLGLRRADDPRIRATTAVVEARLAPVDRRAGPPRAPRTGHPGVSRHDRRAGPDRPRGKQRPTAAVRAGGRRLRRHARRAAAARSRHVPAAALDDAGDRRRQPVRRSRAPLGQRGVRP